MAIIIAALLSFSLLFGGDTDYPPALDFDSLHELHLAYLEQYKDHIEANSNEGEAYAYYDFSYYLHGILSAAEATKDKNLLIDAIQYCDNMINAAEDLNGDGHEEWPELLGEYPNQLCHYQVYSPMARTAALIVNTSEFQTEFQNDANRIYDFVYDNAITYWHVEVYNYQIPWMPQDLGGWGSYEIWNDKCTHFATTATFLYQVTGDSICHDIASRIATGFRRKLVPNGDGWIWDTSATLDQYDDRNTIPYVDVSHANREPMMMVFMHEAGIEFSREDVQRMAATLTEIIWNDTLQPPHFSNYINGSNADYNNCGQPYCVGNVYSGWVLLGKYSEKAQQILTYTLKAIDEGTSIGQNHSSYGKVALSGHLLRNAVNSSVSTVRFGESNDFSIENLKNTEIKIFNILGHERKVLISEELPWGHHSINWNGKNNFQMDAANGVYILQYLSNGKTLHGKVILKQ
jgi:hypothetical protein